MSKVMKLKKGTCSSCKSSTQDFKCDGLFNFAGLTEQSRFYKVNGKTYCGFCLKKRQEKESK